MYILLVYAVLSVFALIKMAKEKTNKIYDVLCIVVLLGIVLSFPIGRDTGGYIMSFHRVSGFADAFHYHMQRNFGFNALLYITKRIVPSYSFFRLVVNVMTLGLIGYVVKRRNTDPLPVLLLFVGSGVLTVYYASGIRQMIAMAIFCFAYFRFLEEKKYLPYAALVVLAGLFHELSFVGLLLIPLSLCLDRIQKEKKKYLIWGAVLSIIGFLVMRFVPPWLVKVLGYDSVLTHGLIYFTGGSISVIGIALRIVMIVVNAVLYLWAENRDESDDLFITVSFVSFFIYIMFCRYSIMSRVSDFIAVIELIKIPELLVKISEKNKRVLACFGLILLNAVLLYTDIKEKTGTELGARTYTMENYPYTFLWDTKTIDLMYPQE